MNREQAKKLLLIIQAFADGAVVQYRNDDKWHDVEDPTFYPRYEWRIKPKPLERWFVLDKDGDPRVCARGFDDETTACCALDDLKIREVTYSPYRVVHMREVTL